jgi:hypothetical protein
MIGAVSVHHRHGKTEVPYTIAPKVPAGCRLAPSRANPGHLRVPKIVHPIAPRGCSDSLGPAARAANERGRPLFGPFGANQWLGPASTARALVHMDSPDCHVTATQLPRDCHPTAESLPSPTALRPLPAAASTLCSTQPASTSGRARTALRPRPGPQLSLPRPRRPAASFSRRSRLPATRARGQDARQGNSAGEAGGASGRMAAKLL